MYVLNITDEYDSFSNCTDNENVVIIIILKYFFSSTPSCALLLSLISLFIWTTLKRLISLK